MGGQREKWFGSGIRKLERSLRLRTLPLPEGCGEQRPSAESPAPVKKEGEATFREERRI